MRICFVSHSGYMGGAERALLEAISALSKRGVTCHVLLPYEGPICDELSRLKVTFRIVKYRSWVYKRNESWWYKINDLLISLIMVVPASIAIMQWRSTIVYTNTITIFTGALAALFTGRPHVWHIHEFGYQDHGLRFLFSEKQTRSLVNRFSILCIAASKAIAEAYRLNILPSKLKVVYQSVSLPDSVITVKRSNEFTCVIVGKISEGKKQEDAVKAVAELKEKGISAKLYIVGDGFQEYITLLKKIIHEYDIENEVEFVGHTKNAISYMRMADVVLMCSRSEGFGRVTIEGMLVGKPLIGSNGGATRELIQEGITGLLYTPGNYKELAQKIELLYRNSSMAEQMGINAKKWAEFNFSEERCGSDLMRVLINVTASGVKFGKS